LAAQAFTSFAPKRGGKSVLAVPMPKTAIAIAPAIKNKEKTLLFGQESFSYKKVKNVNTNDKFKKRNL
jgi:hypothetical protein